MSFSAQEINPQNIRELDVNELVDPQVEPLNPVIAGYLKKYIGGLVKSLPGNVQTETAAQLATGLADFESRYPLYSATPFRYAALPHLPKMGVECSAQTTLDASLANMAYMTERFGEKTFAAELPDERTFRAVTWVAPIDDDFQLQVRGASGAGTFSVDFGLGMIDRKNRACVDNYKELWRTGVDTVPADDGLGARFIRTGSAIKGGDNIKQRAFYEFRMRHGIMPQRLLGLVGMYFMREIEPDYAVALTIEGARAYSTLGRSKGTCNYNGIFGDIGFEPSTDRNWQLISEYNTTGFYNALTKARLKRREEPVLQSAIDSLNNMQLVNPLDEAEVGRILFPLCSDDAKTVLEREVRAAYDTRGFKR